MRICLYLQRLLLLEMSRNKGSGKKGGATAGRPVSFAFLPYILPYDTSIEEKAVFYDDCA